MKILILFAHPAFHKSRVNKVLMDGLSDYKGITYHDLYDHYPELDIDVEHEQELLSQHDCIIFHFPLFWYSTPAILKEWQDLVLEHGWAYGKNGKALKGKLFFCAITTGGPEMAYQEGRFHQHTLKQFLAPLDQTARLCKMKPLPPFVIHATHAIETDGILDSKIDYYKILQKILEDNFDIEKAKPLKYLNDYLNKEEE